MIPESAIPLVRQYLPRLEAAARKHAIDPALLLAMGWVASGLDGSATEASGAQGRFLMPPSAAAQVAARLGRAAWDLRDAATAVDFACDELARLLQQFVLPRVALAAFAAGPAAAERAGRRVPDRPETGRYVRDVMAVWGYLRESLADLRARPHPFVDRKWRMAAPPDDWRGAVAIPDAALPVLGRLAENLGLAFHVEPALRRVYLGVPVPAAPAKAVVKGRLVSPVAGLTGAHCGLYPGADGLDLLLPRGTPVMAAAGGKAVYSASGSILIALDDPFRYGQDAPYPLLHYAGLSRLRHHVPDGSRSGPHVAPGELLAGSGGGRVPYLTLRLLSDRARTRCLDPFKLAAALGLPIRGYARMKTHDDELKDERRRIAAMLCNLLLFFEIGESAGFLKTDETSNERENLLCDFVALTAAIPRLPRGERQVISALGLLGMTQEETASALGIGQPAVHYRLNSAAKRIQKIWNGP